MSQAADLGQETVVEDSPQVESETQEAEMQESEEDIVKATIDEIRAELSELKNRTERAELAKKKAEEALVAERKAHAEAKKENLQKLTAEEQLQEREQEILQKENELRTRMNRTAAREALAPLGLSDKEMTEDDLSLYVCSDEVLTTARCQHLADLIKRRETLSYKAGREKGMKETPRPESGGGDIQENKELESKVKRALGLT